MSTIGLSDRVYVKQPLFNFSNDKILLKSNGVLPKYFSNANWFKIPLKGIDDDNNNNGFMFGHNGFIMPESYKNFISYLKGEYSEYISNFRGKLTGISVFIGHIKVYDTSQSRIKFRIQRPKGVHWGEPGEVVLETGFIPMHKIDNVLQGVPGVLNIPFDNQIEIKSSFFISIVLENFTKNMSDEFCIASRKSAVNTSLVKVATRIDSSDTYTDFWIPSELLCNQSLSMGLRPSTLKGNLSMMKCPRDIGQESIGFARQSALVKHSMDTGLLVANRPVIPGKNRGSNSLLAKNNYLSSTLKKNCRMLLTDGLHTRSNNNSYNSNNSIPVKTLNRVKTLRPISTDNKDGTLSVSSVSTFSDVSTVTRPDILDHDQVGCDPVNDIDDDIRSEIVNSDQPSHLRSNVSSCKLYNNINSYHQPDIQSSITCKNPYDVRQIIVEPINGYDQLVKQPDLNNIGQIIDEPLNRDNNSRYRYNQIEELNSNNFSRGSLHIDCDNLTNDNLIGDTIRYDNGNIQNGSLGLFDSGYNCNSNYELDLEIKEVRNEGVIVFQIKGGKSPYNFKLYGPSNCQKIYMKSGTYFFSNLSKGEYRLFLVDDDDNSKRINLTL